MSPHELATADEWAEHVLSAALGAMDTLAIHLGDRLGWYRALADQGPLSATALAERTGTDTRYAHEWLAHQAAAGMVTADEHDGVRVFSLPDGAAEALTDGGSLAYVSPLARMLAAAASQMPALLDAYRTGGGVSWADLGDDARWAQADINRPWFETMLAPSVAAVPELHDVLGRPDARIADVACGAGWSAIALARAYPTARIIGIDVDEPSVARAREHVRAAGLEDRVEVVHADGESLGGPFDAAFIFEALHDMPQPVAVLSAVREAVSPDGAVVVMDEAVADEPAEPGDLVERLMYGYSLLVCLPDSMSSTPTAATGTVMREPVLRGYATEAGFTDVSVLPIEDFAFFRFYRLHH
ncbi:class I SAM-dependent methyltransferase [Demequina mangrovi]|uniref:Methyltransferase domain-containing protein n=1 Tax=Demequina mangrovi TaxID=1043493 RepID=A0A1H6TVL5_9MICO|nr:methyltransferase domain-containing protein [Demequina mangrovi]SEI84051.1 Methyltransferase domain-containing protein [Demequina mangrovi]